MRKITSRNTIFESNYFSIINGNDTITVLYQDIDKIIYIKNSYWNWLTGRTHAVIPGRIHVFLKSDNGNNRYSLIIPNDKFNELPISLVNKLPAKYKNY